MILHLRLANALRARLFRLLFARRFAAFGRKTLVLAPIAIEGAERIHLGEGVYVAAQSCLAAQPHSGAEDCRLEIGDGCRIGRFNHIYATRRVVLGRKVLTANGVYISDNAHAFRDIARPVLDQPIEQLQNVEIGDGSWVGHNACILGVTIGKGCVVGANAVVTKNLPDFCVAVGAPARIIQRYDAETGKWCRTSPDGLFLQTNSDVNR
jgi:acetyltransferase-like isoleucine patch superfamily enzyme